MTRHIFLASAAALLLAGCNNSTVIAQCPSTSVLTETADLTVFRPGAPQDLSGEAYTAAMGNIEATCKFSRTDGATLTSSSFLVRVTRAPSPDALRVSLPYYIAVTQGERILSKQSLVLNLDFAPGASTVTQDVNPDDITVKLEPGHPPTDYQILFGFQVTDAQRAYNQTRARFKP